MWLSYSKSREFSGPVKDTEIAEASTSEVKSIKARRISLKDYAVIGKQNVFRPQRREWTAPPPVPVKSKPPAVIKKVLEPLPPAPLPDPAVMGIIMEEDGERIAIMQGHRREKIEVRMSSRSRRRGPPRRIPDRIVADKMKTYHEGDTISEAVILEIKEDTVVIEKDGEKIELRLGNKSSERVPSSIKRSVTRKNRPWTPSRRLPTTYEQPATADTGEFPLKYPKGVRRERLEKFRKSRAGGAYRRRFGVKPESGTEE